MRPPLSEEEPQGAGMISELPTIREVEVYRLTQWRNSSRTRSYVPIVCARKAVFRMVRYRSKQVCFVYASVSQRPTPANGLCSRS